MIMVIVIMLVVVSVVLLVRTATSGSVGDRHAGTSWRDSRRATAARVWGMICSP
ncbi:hypothetical protein FHX74_000627 [Friedmanniella endophytica]|uniref:Uncharacterized protein n=1 Tax=Microlunatus kandeliicorticis TaxID=1759536 RepID=A0A7W3P4L1_9ACTN|nr:hypothetical protein [Microlunatus kandeliicorticis]